MNGSFYVVKGMWKGYFFLMKTAKISDKYIDKMDFTRGRQGGYYADQSKSE